MCLLLLLLVLSCCCCEICKSWRGKFLPLFVCISCHPTQLFFFWHWGWLGLFFFSFGFGFGFGFVVAVFGFVEVGGARDTVSWFGFSKCAGGRKGKKLFCWADFVSCSIIHLWRCAAAWGSLDMIMGSSESRLPGWGPRRGRRTK